MVFDKSAFYENILQLKMGYVILKLVLSKDMFKIKAVVIILKILINIVNFNIGFAFSKGTWSAFSEGPATGPGLLCKV